MLISLFPIPFDHFHFLPTLGLDPALILTLRHKYIQFNLSEPLQGPKILYENGQHTPRGHFLKLPDAQL